ncbi:unnamed protein product [Lathyrus oleraceus]
MTAIKAVHHMKSKMRGKVVKVVLKLDIRKAYDQINWDYLKEVLLKMRFNQKWMGWIMLFMKNVDYSVIVNATMVESIVPDHGLRQGDPLSPYLFILCSEGLPALIK